MKDTYEEMKKHVLVQDKKKSFLQDPRLKREIGQKWNELPAEERALYNA